MIRLLENPLLFSLWSRVTGDIAVKKNIISKYILPFEGAKILDIGCGTGILADLLNDVAPVSYMGFDSNPGYIEYAKKKKYPGIFIAGDAGNIVFPEKEFDIIVALDVLHHISDEQAQQMLGLVKKCLKPNGRFILLDPVIRPEQTFFEKKLMNMDRGKHIRSADVILKILQGTFVDIKTKQLSGSYLIPWTECVFCCQL